MEAEYIADRVKLVIKTRADLKDEFNYGSSYFSPAILIKIGEVDSKLAQLEDMFRDWFNEQSADESRTKAGI